MPSFLRDVLADERGFLGFIGKAIGGAVKGVAKSVFGGGGSQSQPTRIASVDQSARLERERLFRELNTLRQESLRQQRELETSLREEKGRSRQLLLFGGGGAALLVVFLVMKR